MPDEPLYSVADIKRGLASINATYRQLAGLISAGTVAPSLEVPGRHLYTRERLWFVYLHLMARKLSGWVPLGGPEERMMSVPGQPLDSLSEDGRLYLEHHGPFYVTVDVVAARDGFDAFMAAVQGEQSP